MATTFFRMNIVIFFVQGIIVKADSSKEKIGENLIVCTLNLRNNKHMVAIG